MLVLVAESTYGGHPISVAFTVAGHQPTVAISYTAGSTYSAFVYGPGAEHFTPKGPFPGLDPVLRSPVVISDEADVSWMGTR